MIPKQWKGIVSVVALSIMPACRCTGPANAGSETTSGVEIAVEGTTVRTTTAAGAIVMIFDEHYVSGNTRLFTDTATVDEGGDVAFTDLPPGNYNIFIYPESPFDSGAVFFNISVGTQYNAVFADTESFKPLRTLRGTVTRQGQPGPYSLVFIPGSPYRAETDAEGKFSFTGVPEGVYTVTVHPSTESDSGDKSFVIDLSATDDAVVDATLELQ
ncbi:MAG: carboxypeptidase regulatory-like domain-containing protein [Chitinispirillaceae bacterium]|nr:carboxypeptidase regulatory-like domain-containing protein [Chitinispirillaceae bacterium]